MTHEIKVIFETALDWQKQGIRSVFVSLVHLEGSSYRKPGVRMLISETGKMVGALSGGCVEKEIARQAASVFEDNRPKLMIYDGRFRLGCEGQLYILIEPLHELTSFVPKLLKHIEKRDFFRLITYYGLEEGPCPQGGSRVEFQAGSFPLRPSLSPDTGGSNLSQNFGSLFRLYLFGAEYDAIMLCKMASQLGWEVTVIAAPDEKKSIDHFVGAKALLTPIHPQEIEALDIDQQTALVLMSHSFNKDSQYLRALKEKKAAYFGVLGPHHRRDKLINTLLEMEPDLSLDFVDGIQGPVGLDIGAQSAAEIAVAILAEILAKTRQKNPISLNQKKGRIHD